MISSELLHRLAHRIVLGSQGILVSASLLGAAFTVSASVAHASTPAPATVSASEALALLMDGNERFVAGTSTHPHSSPARRSEVANGQHPVAVIVTCADSRVGPELLFDQGLGDVFVIRVAGNVSSPHVLGSIEYAVEHLHTPLVMVLGHERCGAVAAARDVLASGTEAPGNIQSLVKAIKPAVKATKGQPLQATVEANVHHVVGKLTADSEILEEKAGYGHIHIVGASYDLDTGEVDLLVD